MLVEVFGMLLIGGALGCGVCRDMKEGVGVGVRIGLEYSKNEVGLD